ncbi:hypothetical protein JG688_00002129 [Phytophthora aleatoria]|uniref:Cyclic nucleotide-binding domain-containing protein n=1 Tax=Phytophthora aleatoria TaxID=2496075 RepID=A0A8J5IV17_9STRA|nr:hypothetical protein JG688_00002129 [Phytophthora aleatoria]
MCRASWQEQPSHEQPEVRANLRRILLLSEVARCKADYEFLDNYIENVKYFRELPPRDRLRFLKAAKGIELDDGDALFRIGDRADAFYCIMFGTMSVVMDFSRMAAPTLNEFEEIMNRARVHSSFLNPGGKLDTSHDATYVVRTMKPLEVFGDVGLLLEEQQRTASVVATETTLLMQIDRDTFMGLRARNLSRELREKMTFLAGVACLDHWEDEGILKLCDRMEKIQHTYNDVIVAEGEPAKAHKPIETFQASPLVGFDEHKSHSSTNRSRPHAIHVDTMWARQHAGSGDNTSSGHTDKNQQALVSNVQWGKASQIMGGLRNDDDKVSTAIVDLFKAKGAGH